MTYYLLDTNHLSPLVTEGHPLRDRILERLQNGDVFAIPAVVLSEFLFGIRILPRAEQNQRAWSLLSDNFIYYDLDRSDAEQAADLRLFLRKKGRQLALPDALIAVVALRYNLILLTQDADFSAVPNLQHESWW
jgi:predicted nucleic acid-binding protein